MKNLSISALCLLFSLSGCAEEPKAVVSPIDSFIGGETQTPGQDLTLNSLVFAGADFFGQSCHLHLALKEEKGGHSVLAKLEYSLHGQTLPDLETGVYRYDLSQNQYSDVHSTNGSIAFAGALVHDVDDVDVNQLPAYEAQGELIYSLRVDLSAADFHDYEEAMEIVLDDPSQLAAYSSTLNQVNRAIFKIGHAGHYDAAGCVGFNLEGVEEVTFEVGDHGHDDDHDDDHDHDHDDHDHP